MGGWAHGLKKIGDVYWCRFRFQGQEIHRSTGCADVDDAMAWLLEFRKTLKAAAGGEAPAPSVRMLLEEWRKAFKGVHRDVHLVRVEASFRPYLLEDFGDVAADALTTADLARVQRKYLTSCGPTGARHMASTANAMASHWRLVWKWGVSDGLLKAMTWKLPLLDVKRKPKATLPASIVDAFLVAVDKARNPHVGISVRAQLYLGLRESESLHLRYEWFTHGFSSYTPGKLMNGRFESKGGEAVAVPVPPGFRDMILATLPADAKAPYKGFVIPALDGQPHRGEFTKLAVRRAGNAVGIHGLTPHRMRRTCATLLARQGVDLESIQQFLRHKDIRTTMGYIETDFSSIIEAQAEIYGGTKGGTKPDENKT